MATPALLLLLFPLVAQSGAVHTLCTDADGDGLCEDADCDDEDASVGGPDRYYPDVDGDGYGDLAGMVEECTQPEGYTSGTGDCDDSRADISPLGTEVCDGLDNDCDEDIDVGRVQQLGGEVDLCLDTDADGLTDASEAVLGTDPVQTDTDLDGLRDCVEVGLSAAQTIDGSSSSFLADADPATTTDPLNADTDGDGRLDGKEDEDHDGSVDSGESDPNNPDTDGGGVDDGTEFDNGTDPTDPSDDNETPDSGEGDTDTGYGTGSIDSKEDDGCGCVTGSTSASGLLLALLAGLGLARRRR